jgi:hypothetical protein
MGIEKTTAARAKWARWTSRGLDARGRVALDQWLTSERLHLKKQAGQSPLLLARKMGAGGDKRGGGG